MKIPAKFLKIKYNKIMSKHKARGKINFISLTGAFLYASANIEFPVIKKMVSLEIIF